MQVLDRGEAADPVLVYGATGYTGRLIVAEAQARGLRPILAGRDRARLQVLADATGLKTRVVDLLDSCGMDAALRQARVVLNCAGPFATTARPLVDACLRRGVHYLDIAAEVKTFVAGAARDGEARSRGIMLMPGVGFDVVPTDCLSAHVVRRMPAAQALAIGLSGLSLLSRGSARTMASQVNEGVWIRRRGQLESVTPGTVQHEFDYGEGPRESLAISWADVVSAYYTTGVPDIAVHFEATAVVVAHETSLRLLRPLVRSQLWKQTLNQLAELLPDGPEAGEREQRRAVVVVEARGPDGRVARSRLTCPEAYSMTARTAVAITRRVLSGDLEVGFQTPARVYGADFVLQFPGVRREDL